MFWILSQPVQKANKKKNYCSQQQNHNQSTSSLQCNTLRFLNVYLLNEISTYKLLLHSKHISVKMLTGQVCKDIILKPNALVKAAVQLFSINGFMHSTLKACPITANYHFTANKNGAHKMGGCKSTWLVLNVSDLWNISTPDSKAKELNADLTHFQASKTKGLDSIFRAFIFQAGPALTSWLCNLFSCLVPKWNLKIWRNRLVVMTPNLKTLLGKWGIPPIPHLCVFSRFPKHYSCQQGCEALVFLVIDWNFL